MGEPDNAIQAYDHAIRHNPYSINAMNAISHILRAKEKFPEAMEYLRSILKLDPQNGDVWGSLGKSADKDRLPLGNADRTRHRALLSDDGQLARGLYCLPTGALLSS